MPHASQNPEGRVWQKMAKRLAKSRLVLAPVAVVDDDGRDDEGRDDDGRDDEGRDDDGRDDEGRDDDGRDDDGVQAGSDVFNNAAGQSIPVWQPALP